MLNEIWENLKNTFSLIYDKILSKFIKPLYLTLSLFCLYYFIIYMIHYEILAAFANLFVAIIMFKLSEGD